MTSNIHSRLPITFAFSLYFLILIRTAWIQEDAFITFRTVRNLLDGFGPVWNIGERVQSYTHPLWMMLLTGTIGISQEFYYTTIAVCLVLSIVTILILVFSLADSLAAAMLALLLLSFSKAYTDFSTSGLENPLTHLLLVLFAYVYFSGGKRFKQAEAGVAEAENQNGSYGKRQLFFGSLLVALLTMNRMDLAVICFPALCYMWYRTGWRAGLLSIAVGFTPFILWELFSLFYYGFPFPNTAYAKLNTGVPRAEYLQKGLIYLIQSTGMDPMTSAGSGIGIGLALANPSLRDRLWAAGPIIYLGYVVSIGGDYMAGRFLTAPFLCAVIFIALNVDRYWTRTTVMPTMLFVIIIGLMSWQQSPFITSEAYDFRPANNAGIADERSWYNLALGLQSVSRHNRAFEMNLVQGYLDPENLMDSGMGRFGFNASSHTHIIDLIGLTDPLLARLPARYNPNWRIGHPARVAPAGYESIHYSDRNNLSDPDLARYYDKLKMVVEGELWSLSRLGEIWRFNIGAYEHLIDTERYRYPKRVERSLDQVTRRNGGSADHSVVMPIPLPLNQDGVLVLLDDAGSLDGTVPPQFLAIGLHIDRFTIIYKNGGKDIGKQKVRAEALRMGSQVYHAVMIPEEVLTAGFDAVHIRPDLTDEFTLTFVDLVGELSQHDPGASPFHYEQTLELVYYIYYRGQRAERARSLDALIAEIQQMSPETWAALSREKLLALLKIPDASINALILNHIPGAVVLTDPNKEPMLRYLGHLSAPVPVELGSEESGGRESEDGHIGEEPLALEVNLWFNSIGQLTQEHTIWFHIKAIEGDREWMIYDQEVDPSVTQWTPSVNQTVSALINLEPGRYDIAFGFWTPDRQRLYVDRESDIYWISLGEHVMPEEESE